MENMETMKKKEMELRAIFEKIQKVPADKIDYTAGASNESLTGSACALCHYLLLG